MQFGGGHNPPPKNRAGPLHMMLPVFFPKNFQHIIHHLKLSHKNYLTSYTVYDMLLTTNIAGPGKGVRTMTNTEIQEASPQAELVVRFGKIIGKIARLKANGISDKSVCTVCGISPSELATLQTCPEYTAKYEIAEAAMEVKPLETTTGIATLEEEALKQTIYNVQQGYADPSFVLDALKYATKVRLEEKKLEQEKQASFNANTQIVINMNTLLQNALHNGQDGGTVVFKDDSKSVVNGLDTDTLYNRAMGIDQNAGPALPAKPVKEVTSLRVEDIDDILFVNSEEDKDE